MGLINRLEMQQATAATHTLEIQDKALSTGFKHSKPQQSLTTWKVKEVNFTHIERQWGKTATH